LLYLRGGRWQKVALVKPEFAKLALSSPEPADLPLTSGTEAAMLPGQRTLGGTRNITPVGPGYYSFNWWLNRTDRADHRLLPGAPADAYVACGHGGTRMLWVFPGCDLIVCWNDARIDDFDASPVNPRTRCNQAARLIAEAVIPTKD
jgi:hypothetical protein